MILGEAFAFTGTRGFAGGVHFRVLNGKGGENDEKSNNTHQSPD